VSQGVMSRVGRSLTSATPSPVIPAVNPSDVKFSAYMGKALETIDTKVKSADPVANVPALNGVTSPESLPLVKVPGAKPAIGIGNLPQPTALVPNAVTPSVPIADAARNELNQAVAKLSSLVDRMTNGSNNASNNPSNNVSSNISSNGTANRPAVGVQRSSATAIRPAPVVSPAPLRTLKGILGNGDRSAVMFELNGVTQSYEKGEKIGGSGWVLIRVEDGNAIVRRNGEVRTLSVGQKI